MCAGVQCALARRRSRWTSSRSSRRTTTATCGSWSRSSSACSRMRWESRTRQEDEVYTGLLCVAFLLVEDDVDGVVSAAERRGLRRRSPRGPRRARVPADADRQPRDVRGDPRLRGADTSARAAKVLGPEVFASGDSRRCSSRSPGTISSRFERRPRARSPRSAAAGTRIAEATLVSGGGFSRGLARDDVWSVRRAVAETLVSMSACVTSGAFEALVADLFESLANDVSYQVRAAMLEHLGPLISALAASAPSRRRVDHFGAARAESGASSGQTTPWRGDCSSLARSTCPAWRSPSGVRGGMKSGKRTRRSRIAYSGACAPNRGVLAARSREDPRRRRGGRGPVSDFRGETL